MSGYQQSDSGGGSGKNPLITCTPKRLPEAKLIDAAAHARSRNPLNFAPVHRLVRLMPEFESNKARLAVVTTKYWGGKGVDLSVGFLDSPTTALRRLILEHMNAWNRTANIRFRESSHPGSAQVRIARMEGSEGGYWSYLGTDIEMIDAGQPTMNLERFTEFHDDSEFRRVVRHEAGHTIGFSHEHMRRQLVALIDPQKAREYYHRTQGWSAAEVDQQVLTPLEEASLLGTPSPDPYSIMCYQIPGEITFSGRPIIGGEDIDQEDAEFAARIYPKPVADSAKEEEVLQHPGEILPAAHGAAVIEILPEMTRITISRPPTSARSAEMEAK